MKKEICIGSLPGDSTEARFRLAKQVGPDGIEIGTLENAVNRRRHREIADTLELELFSVMNQKHWSHPLSHRVTQSED